MIIGSIFLGESSVRLLQPNLEVLRTLRIISNSRVILALRFGLKISFIDLGLKLFTVVNIQWQKLSSACHPF